MNVRTTSAWIAFLALATLGGPAAARAGEAGKIDVKVVNSADYKEKGLLDFIVDVNADEAPVENMDKATWNLSFQNKKVDAVPTVVGFRNANQPAAFLVLIAATGNFTGADEADVDEKDRSVPPVQYVLEGLQTLKNSIGQKDQLSLGCYDNDKANPFALGGPKNAGDVPIPDLQRFKDKCRPSDSAGQPRLQTLLSTAVKQWFAKRKEIQRLVVIIVTDGNSKEPIQDLWWKSLQTELGDKAWLEIFVVGLEDGGDPAKLQSLAKGGMLNIATVRKDLSEEIGKLGQQIGGTGLYKLTYKVEDSIKGPAVELVLGATDSRGEFKSEAVPMGLLERKSSWVRIVILVLGILVGLVVIFLLIRVIGNALAEKRRREEEEAAAAAKKQYDGPSKGKLVVRAGPAMGTTYHLVEDLSYIGRSPDNHISIPDTSVGKRHCSIRISDKSYLLEDLQSVNGVMVNGQKQLKVHLKDGDAIRLGQTEMQFSLQ